ncbi:MAG: hydantoinase B/oxoprolinase family protein, partial [Deltaproteobacteria bacterium]|nr:hydantoinase B/oxoprolinase family protein [Deltaproteobacteria bacterium]
HAPDMAVLTPIFYRGEWVGFAANMAHKSDIGGTVPGSGSGQAREVFQEGIHFPPIKYVSGWQTAKEIEAILTANSRTPRLVVGDLRGQAGANRLGAKRVVELMERYGKETVLVSTDQLASYTENRVRQAIRSWPDGVSEGEGFVDHDGINLDRPIRIHVVVKKKGDALEFDFSGCSDQTQGPANIRPPLVQACCSYSLVSLIDARLPINEGLTRVFRSLFRAGSVVDPRFPAAVNTYMPTAHVVVEAILRALGHFVAGKRVAGGSGSAAIVLGGRQAEDRRAFVHYEIFTGGTGARTGRDGVSAIAFHLSNCKTAPIEIIESEFPTRVERFELIPDSGGAGLWRGGLGFVRDYRILQDEVRFSMRTDKHDLEPWGMDAGKNGRKGACIVNPGGRDEKRLPSRFGDFPLKAGDLLRVERPGGGGIGDPFERPREKVLEDVRQGYVSVQAAASGYGIVLQKRRDELVLDSDEALRPEQIDTKKAGNRKPPMV